MITQVLELATRFVKSRDPMHTSAMDPTSSVLYLPVRATIWPLTTLAMMTPSRSGNSS